MQPQSFHGLLVIDKPAGITSRDAVDRVQRWFPPHTRIGHTGTLDPLATGVLVLCINVATRLTEFVQNMPKTYRAGLRLGARSDTDDLEGNVEQVKLENPPNVAAIEAALGTFIGGIEQVPPSYSAAKVAGRRAYALARRGRTVTLEARKVTIHGIDIIAFEYPQLDLEIRCGKGTYIRSLARDLGDKLGCGALLESLRRTRVGPFAVENALPLDQEPAVALSRMLPLAAAVADLPRVILDQVCERTLVKGQTVSLPRQQLPVSGNSLCAAFAVDGRMIAVCRWNVERCELSPLKVVAH
jgi:tRNA pseudouridine55 synthase